MQQQVSFPMPDAPPSHNANYRYPHPLLRLSNDGKAYKSVQEDESSSESSIYDEAQDVDEVSLAIN